MICDGESDMIELKAAFSPFRRNERGFVIGSVLMILALVTIIGVMSIRTSTEDIDISANTQIYNQTFFAAEAARAYVKNNSALYGSGNITTGTPVNFPDAADSTITQPIVAGAPEEFNGMVEYLNSTVPPRGSGYAIGKFRAHVYQMNCRGHGPRGAATEIEAGFYRIGF